MGFVLPGTESDPYADYYGWFKRVRKAVTACRSLEALEEAKEEYAYEIRRLREFAPPHDGVRCEDLHKQVVEMIFSQSQMIQQLEKE